MSKTLLTGKRGKFFFVTFNRPEKKNCINPQWYEQLPLILQEADEDPETAFTVFTDYFSAGSEFDLSTASEEKLASKNPIYVPFIDELIEHKKILIAFVNGPCVGIGVTMLTLFDLATFTTPFTRLGLCAEGTSTYNFPASMGKLQANRLLLFSEKINAKEAHDLGLVTQVVPHNQFEEVKRKTLIEVDKLAPGALLAIKQLVMNNGLKQKLREHHKEEARALVARYRDPDTLEHLLRSIRQRKSKIQKHNSDAALDSQLPPSPQRCSRRFTAASVVVAHSSGPLGRAGPLPRHSMDASWQLLRGAELAQSVVMPLHRAAASGGGVFDGSPPQAGGVVPQLLRRESMTRLFLKPDAVFKAYEQEQEMRDQLHHHRHSLRPKQPSIEEHDSRPDAPDPHQRAGNTSSSTSSSPPRHSPSVPVGCLQPSASPSSTSSSTREPPCLIVVDESATPPPRIQRSSSVQQPSSSLKVGVADANRRRCSSAMDSVRREDPEQTYKVYKQLGTGRFGFVKLAEHRDTGKTVALKFFPRAQTKQSDFLREYNYSRTLSSHSNIINTFDGVFQASDDSAFYFVQEFCPHASLREAVEGSTGGIGEARTKGILLSVLNAIEYMHNEGLVHRNIKAENVLIFDPNDYTQIKVTDFGLTRKVDTTVKHLEYTNQYHAPELCDTVVNEMCTVAKALDIWALGIIVYYCLRGKHPWQKASIVCKPYWEWEQWLRHKLPQLPRRYDVFTEKAIKLQKRCLNPRAKDRWTVKDLRRYLEKEKLLKPVKMAKQMSSDYYLEEESDKRVAGRSGLGHWLNSTLSTMAEISEQVVSARNQ